MPIHRSHRCFYPTNLLETPRRERIQRTKSRCEKCGRPGGKTVAHLADGRWWDVEAMMWRSDTGKALPDVPPLQKCQETILYTKVILVHVDHDLSNNAPTKLRAFCQRCCTISRSKRVAVLGFPRS